MRKVWLGLTKETLQDWSKSIRMAKKKGPQFYAVARGEVPGIYRTWDETKQQVDGYPGARHRAFSTEKEALDFIDENSSSSGPAFPYRITLDKVPEDNIAEEMVQLQDAQIRQQYEIPPTAEVIYTDGACPSNGRIDRRAGIGVFFGLNDPRNISARLPGRQQTNQRAELFAVLKALETLYLSSNQSPTPSTSPRNVFILTDSQYVIDAITQWIPSWEVNNWRTKQNTQVVSLDLFQRAKEMLKTLEERGIHVGFRHVPGHQGVWGNEQADRLAVAGAWMDQVRDLEWDPVFDDDELDRLIEEWENV